MGRSNSSMDGANSLMVYQTFDGAKLAVFSPEHDIGATKANG